MGNFLTGIGLGIVHAVIGACLGIKYSVIGTLLGLRFLFIHILPGILVLPTRVYLWKKNGLGCGDDGGGTCKQGCMCCYFGSFLALHFIALIVFLFAGLAFGQTWGFYGLAALGFFAITNGLSGLSEWGRWYSGKKKEDEEELEEEKAELAEEEEKPMCADSFDSLYGEIEVAIEKDEILPKKVEERLLAKLNRAHSKKGIASEELKTLKVRLFGRVLA